MVHPAVYAAIPIVSLGLAAIYYVFRSTFNGPHSPASNPSPSYGHRNNASSSKKGDLRRRRKFEYDGSECQICQDAKSNIEILPCHHKEICEGCVNAIITKVDRLCPFCRQYIKGYQEI